MNRGQYTEGQRTEAIALAAAIGPLKAGKKLGIATSTITYWMHRPAARPVIAAVERDIASALRAAHAETLASVLAGVRDPKSRLGERAAALRVLGEQLALAEGSSSLNVELHATGLGDDGEDLGPPLTPQGRASRLPRANHRGPRRRPPRGSWRTGL